MKGKFNYSSNAHTENHVAINEYIGNRIKLRRSSLGITQEKLSSYLGITFQQIQKYENGKNRVSAGSLFLISKFLDTDPTYFFEGYSDVCDKLHGIHCIQKCKKDKYLNSFMKLYNQFSNSESKCLLLEISRIILRFCRKSSE